MKFVKTIDWTYVDAWITFIYHSACGVFTKHREKIQKFKETSDSNYIYKNELDKACFAHATAYSDSKNLAKRTV